jgi:hypothetical protein
MQNPRWLPALALASSLLLGLVPLRAGPEASAAIGDLLPEYDGRFHTTDGSDQSGTVNLDVANKDGKNFTGDISYSFAPTKMGAGASGFGPLPCEGSVSPKGKISVAADAGEGRKFSLKGVLSDGGELITAVHVLKQGKTVLLKGICWLTRDE